MTAKVIIEIDTPKPKIRFFSKSSADLLAEWICKASELGGCVSMPLPIACKGGCYVETTTINREGE